MSKRYCLKIGINKEREMKLSKDLLKGMAMGTVLTLGLSASVGAAASNGTFKMLHAYFNDIKINVEGKDVKLLDQQGNKVEPFIVDGTTYLPVRGISEALGQKIDWDSENSRVIIGEVSEANTKGYKTIQELKPYEKDSYILLGGFWEESGVLSIRQKEYVNSSNIRGNGGHGDVTYILDGNYSSITGLFGVDDLATTSAGSTWDARLEIYGDNELLYWTDSFKGDELENVGIDLQDVDTLRIHLWGDYGNFFDIKLHEK